MNGVPIAIWRITAVPAVLLGSAAVFLPKLRDRRLLFVDWEGWPTPISSSIYFLRYISWRSIGHEVFVIGCVYSAFRFLDNVRAEGDRPSRWANGAYVLMLIWLLAPKYAGSLKTLMFHKMLLVSPSSLLVYLAIVYLGYIGWSDRRLCPVATTLAAEWLRRAGLVLMSLVGIASALLVLTWICAVVDGGKGYFVFLVAFSVVSGVGTVLCWVALICFEVPRWRSFAVTKSTKVVPSKYTDSTVSDWR